jgi:hypothetical protein
MLHDLTFLDVGQQFPPASEVERLKRYSENEKLFETDHADCHKEIYEQCFRRITRVVGNFENYVCFPVILNYQRLLSLKTADLICGEYPRITCQDQADTDEITTLRAETNFDENLFPTVIDLSRFGDAIWRIYKDEDTSRGTFTVWTPKEWFPVVKNDGTKKITHQVLAWRVDLGTKDNHNWHLYAQIHTVGQYEKREYQMDSDGKKISRLLSTSTVGTGLQTNAVIQLSNIRTSSTIYGHDDYWPIDSLVSEAIVRVAQISEILDKHADPVLTGPASMLSVNTDTGKLELKRGKFYAYSPGEEPPEYMVWDGQLDAAFKQLDFIIQQLYIISEMGAALLGAMEKTGQAISGTAMRFKMVNPIIKARRLSNGMLLPTRKLVSSMLSLNGKEIDGNKISVVWKDGLPNDPREQAEIARLVTGLTEVMPLMEAIMEYFEKTPEEAKKWIESIKADQKDFAEIRSKSSGSQNIDPKDKRVNPKEKGSEEGLSDFHGVNN